MKAYAYVRVSSKVQVSGNGFDRQEGMILSYSRQSGYEIVGTFREEGISGTADAEHRPAFQEMLLAILANGVRVIIVERLDRLAREYRTQESLLIYLASKGITLISAATREDVTEAINSDPMNRAIIQLQGIFAELEKNLMVKRLKAGNDRVRMETGKSQGRKGYWELMPELFEAARGGKADGMTYEEIAEVLNVKKYVTVTGKPFSGRVVQDMLRFEKRRKAIIR